MMSMQSYALLKRKTNYSFMILVSRAVQHKPEGISSGTCGEDKISCQGMSLRSPQVDISLPISSRVF
jgi:hypothetical protein